MKTKNALLGLSLLLAMPLPAQEKNYVSEVWVADQGNGKYKNPILYADLFQFQLPAGSADFTLQRPR